MVDYRIKSTEGFSDKIGELVSMLEHTRAVTLEDLKNLSQEDLDYLTDENGNTIGSLLLHIGSVEFAYQKISFENRDINDMERQKWLTALELGDKARELIKNQPLEYYLSELNHIRMNTLEQLKLQEDSWLYEESKWENGIPYNNYWIWFHVMEDEMNHRGQIRTIKRLLLNKK